MILFEVSAYTPGSPARCTVNGFTFKMAVPDAAQWWAWFERLEAAGGVFDTWTRASRPATVEVALLHDMTSIPRAALTRLDARERGRLLVHLAFLGMALLGGREEAVRFVEETIERTAAMLETFEGIRTSLSR